jgi:hypothetical protein
MKYNFCTLFDKNYLLKGLALYYSLLEHAQDFKLWILCMDEESFQILEKMNLINVELIELKQFEDGELLKVKKERKRSEYYWTCTSSLCLFILKNNPAISNLAYLDADLYFYSSPEPIYQEFAGNSVLIIPHNFLEDEKWREEKSGKYNVSMVLFSNNPEALECLQWWRERCLEWCFDYYEDGKLGDQLYLNQWPSKFKHVHVLEHRGANVASWNVEKYKFEEAGEQILQEDLRMGERTQLIFYHFHNIKIYYFLGKMFVHSDINKGWGRHLIFKKYAEGLLIAKNISNTRYGIDKTIFYLLRKIKRMLLFFAA